MDVNVELRINFKSEIKELKFFFNVMYKFLCDIWYFCCDVKFFWENGNSIFGCFWVYFCFMNLSWIVCVNSEL